MVLEAVLGGSVALAATALLAVVTARPVHAHAAGPVRARRCRDR